MKYNQPFDQPSNPNAPYVDGNPSAGIQGSIVPAASIEFPQRELINLMQLSGIVPSNSDLYQLLEAVRSQFVNYLVDQGGANALYARSTPDLLKYSIGQPFRVRVLFANTGPSTFDGGRGPHPIKLAGGLDPSAGALAAGMIALLVWDGTNFQLLNPAVVISGGDTTIYETKIPYVADTSSVANLLVAPFSPAITARVPGDLILVMVAHSNTGATQITVNALPTASVLNRAGAALVANDLVVGQIALLIWSAAGYYQLVTAGLGGGGGAGPGGGGGGFAGSFRGLRGFSAGAVATASWTAAQIAAAASLGAITYLGVNLTLAFNGATVGVNGMDAGAMPASADFSVYAIYNPTSLAWGTLGCAGSVSRGRVYGGTNLPAGYTASCLIWTGVTDGAGHFVEFAQIDGRIDIVGRVIFDGASGGGTDQGYQAASVGAAVPANATLARFGNFHSAGGNMPMLASYPSAAPNPPGSFYEGPYGLGQGSTEVILYTPQVVYWLPEANVMGGGGDAYTLLCVGYSF